MINSVVLVGRIGNDPEMKYTQGGMPIMNFRIAVGRGRKDDDGKELTDWLNVTCFQKTAEFVAKYLDKGALIGIEGRIQSRTWEGSDGKRNYGVDIVANLVRVLESRAEAERRREKSGTAPAGAGGGMDDDDRAVDMAGPIGDDEDPFGDS